MTTAELEFFATPGPTTDLSAHAGLVADLPADPAALGRVVRGLLLHEGVVALRGLQFPPERMADRELATAAAVIERVLDLDASPLEEERPEDQRMIGYRRTRICSKPRCLRSNVGSISVRPTGV